MKKILLKLSGESLGNSGIDSKSLQRTVGEIASAAKFGSIAIVIGGGNIWRFRDNKHLTSLPRIESDYLGMSATVFNAVVLSTTLKKLKNRTKVFSAIRAPTELAEPYNISAVKKFLAKKGIAILAGGTGKPFVTTDSGAAIRAMELKCDLVIKATNVDGVFDRDPRKSKSAKFLKKISFEKAVREKFGVMDLEAFQILRKAQIPISIFNFAKKGLLKKAVEGKNVGSLISLK
jgi:uridylate kinase